MGKERRVETREDLLTETEITFPCQVNEDFHPFLPLQPQLGNKLRERNEFSIQSE